MTWIILWIIGCLVIGYMASGTSLGFWSGFLLSLILSPLIGFIIVLLYPAKKNITPQKDIGAIQDKLSKLESMKPQLSEGEYKMLRNEILNS